MEKEEYIKLFNLILNDVNQYYKEKGTKKLFYSKKYLDNFLKLLYSDCEPGKILNLVRIIRDKKNLDIFTNMYHPKKEMLKDAGKNDKTLYLDHSFINYIMLNDYELSKGKELDSSRAFLMVKILFHIDDIKYLTKKDKNGFLTILELMLKRRIYKQDEYLDFLVESTLLNGILSHDDRFDSKVPEYQKDWKENVKNFIKFGGYPIPTRNYFDFVVKYYEGFNDVPLCYDRLYEKSRSYKPELKDYAEFKINYIFNREANRVLEVFSNLYKYKTVKDFENDYYEIDIEYPIEYILNYIPKSSDLIQSSVLGFANLVFDIRQFQADLNWKNNIEFDIPNLKLYEKLARDYSNYDLKCRIDKYKHKRDSVVIVKEEKKDLDLADYLKNKTYKK
jgi:hypothetical protein